MPPGLGCLFTPPSTARAVQDDSTVVLILPGTSFGMCGCGKTRTYPLPTLRVDVVPRHAIAFPGTITRLLIGATPRRRPRA